MIQAQYAGFAAVVSVTVYELAIKEIFIEFARKKHKVFGSHIEHHLKRLNGRINLKDLKHDQIKRFGEKYLIRFDRLLKKRENEILRVEGKSVTTCYSNLIVWRNEFAHQGRLLTNATYSEVCDAYRLGKITIECLENSMIN